MIREHHNHHHHHFSHSYSHSCLFYRFFFSCFHFVLFNLWINNKYKYTKNTHNFVYICLCMCRALRMWYKIRHHDSSICRHRNTRMTSLEKRIFILFILFLILLYMYVSLIVCVYVYISYSTLNKYECTLFIYICNMLEWERDAK